MIFCDLFNEFPIDGHLDCFLFFPLINNVAVKIFDTKIFASLLFP